MPRYFFDVADGHRLFDKSGFVCDDDADAIVRATVLAIGVSLDKPEDDPERHVAIINENGHKVGHVPVYSKPSEKHPAKQSSQALRLSPASTSFGKARIHRVVYFRLLVDRGLPSNVVQIAQFRALRSARADGVCQRF